MKQHPSIARRCAAVAAAAALVLGSSALLAPGADAAAKPKPKPLKGSLTGTVTFDCSAAGAEFPYDAEIVLKGVRAKKGDKTLKLTATISDLPGVAPVALDYDATSELDLVTGKTTTKLKGTGHVTAGASSPVPIPPMKGSTKNAANSIAITATAFSLTFEIGISVTCTPAEGQGDLGTLKLK